MIEASLHLRPKQLITSKENDRELKIPETIKLAPILSKNMNKDVNFFSARDRKMSLMNNSSLSNVSLSLKYKIEELEKTKGQFIAEIGMHKKRIHKTVFK